MNVTWDDVRQAERERMDAEDEVARLERAARTGGREAKAALLAAYEALEAADEWWVQCRQQIGRQNVQQAAQILGAEVSRERKQ